VSNPTLEESKHSNHLTVILELTVVLQPFNSDTHPSKTHISDANNIPTKNETIFNSDAATKSNSFTHVEHNAHLLLQNKLQHSRYEMQVK
jgi:hypothetical protein